MTLHPPPVRANTPRGSPETHLQESHPQHVGAAHKGQQTPSLLVGRRHSRSPARKTTSCPSQCFLMASVPILCLLPPTSTADCASQTASSHMCPQKGQPSTFAAFKYCSLTMQCSEGTRNKYCCNLTFPVCSQLYALQWPSLAARAATARALKHRSAFGISRVSKPS